MKKSLTHKTVFVGLSGGVDSSVTAHLLKQEGYSVVGVYMKTWQPDFVECTWRDEKRDAMRVAAHLDIPFIFLDVAKEYEKSVAKKMIADYKAGRTPNPDVLCNKDIKFGVFMKFALAKGADFIATGHYARIKKLQATNYQLQTGVDPAKDQAYFLWTLTKTELSHTLFPLGNMTKKEVRKIAAKIGLPTAEKKDSQGICFIGPIDMKEFLSHYIEPKKGSVLDEKGKKIGIHDGAAFYTLGERHGFTITEKTTHDEPYYVIGKDIKKNTITVSQNGHVNYSPIRANKRIELEEVNWVSETPVLNKKYTAQFRYHGEYITCAIEKILFSKKTATAILGLDEPISGGQSIVIYDKDTVIGGGVVL